MRSHQRIFKKKQSDELAILEENERAMDRRGGQGAWDWEYLSHLQQLRSEMKTDQIIE